MQPIQFICGRGGYSTQNYDARVCTELYNNSNPRARLYTAFKCSLILCIYTIIISTFPKMTGPKRGKAMCSLTDTLCPHSRPQQ